MLLAGATPALPARAGDKFDATVAETIIVTARLRPEPAQSVPQALSVVDGEALERSYSNNMRALALLVPSLNYASPNPRNTSFTIRGLGSSVVAVAQANDGLEPGVGIYVDQVYQARPAAAAFDFTDVERLEVLRGPQVSLFGKNSTAGAIQIVSRAPSFTPEAAAEVSFGNLGFWQARGSASGPMSDRVAVRVAGLATRRTGVIRNVETGRFQNNVHTDALRASLLWKPQSSLSVRLTGDWQDVRAECCTQVFLTVSPTLRPVARQYPAMAAAAGYAPPSINAFDRLTDIDAPLGVETSQGGVALVGEAQLGAVNLTSVSAWRFWDWAAANDRDYTRLPIQLVQGIPSRQDQYSQELRLASAGTLDAAHSGLAFVAGLFAFHQKLKGQPTTIYGPLATTWLLGGDFPPGLLDGYGSSGRTRFASTSLAGFGEVTWRPPALARLALTGGLRVTWEGKSGQFNSRVSGGAEPQTAAQASAKLSILRPQDYAASVRDVSLSLRGNLAYDLADHAVAWLSWARGDKSGGINMSGLPVDAAGQPALGTAVIRPERNVAWEAGLRAATRDGRLSASLVLFSTQVRDFQANVVDTGPGALRGYLANIPKVRVQGLEVDAVFAPIAGVQLRAALSHSDGRYVDYRAGPCPLERVGTGTTACDLSGRPLANLPRWSISAGLDASRPLGRGQLRLRVDSISRSSASGDGSASAALFLPGYTLVNASLAYGRGPWEVALFAQNLFDARYLQNVTAQAGNSGLVLATPSDPRLWGLTLRWTV
ncbi:TonB-dependent receptor [Sandarakinorhabdus rubra]|uniref:TonB-dependent receptor n=1 Tax=Sandarakinorhabdus rubra TaxID=2672568 RepID=UPI001F3697A6|nr:TonB-dependent receptor [Sandarakinorhabdus rubra]